MTRDVEIRAYRLQPTPSIHRPFEKHATFPYAIE
jgi:hypothetical protein